MVSSGQQWESSVRARKFEEEFDLYKDVTIFSLPIYMYVVLLVNAGLILQMQPASQPSPAQRLAPADCEQLSRFPPTRVRPLTLPI